MANFSPALNTAAAPESTGGDKSALAVVTLLFFMWGLLTALNDVLIPHLKAVYSLTYVQAMLVQSCFFGAYFLVSLPAGALIRRVGYQSGMVLGLAAAAVGCALFYPASLGGYGLFLLALFTLAAGITLLQVAANPYVTILGSPASASRRLTLTQAFNALGTTVAPVLGGMLILSDAVLPAEEVAQLTASVRQAYLAQQASAVQGPYLVLGAALLVLAMLAALARLPRIEQADAASSGQATLLSQRHLRLGVIAIFLYVGAEVSIGSFLISFLGEAHIAAMPAAAAASCVGYYWGGAMVGRFIGFLLMRRVSPGKVLSFNAACSVGLVVLAMAGEGSVAMWAVLAVGLCNSIMFPTIFSMALYRLGPATGQASGLLCMAIVGGAIVPFGQGLLADRFGVQPSFVLPACCYLFILFFGLKYAGLYSDEA